jgi:hypothetical protein
VSVHSVCRIRKESVAFEIGSDGDAGEDLVEEVVDTVGYA